MQTHMNTFTKAHSGDWWFSKRHGLHPSDQVPGVRKICLAGVEIVGLTLRRICPTFVIIETDVKCKESVRKRPAPKLKCTEAHGIYPKILITAYLVMSCDFFFLFSFFLM